MTPAVAFEPAYFEAKRRARLCSTDELLRIEARLRDDRALLDVDGLARWAAVLSVLVERDVEIRPAPGAGD